MAKLLERSRANFSLKRLKRRIRRMARAKNGANLKFIAQYLHDNPGATATRIRRALCENNGKRYSKGYYTEYFYSSGIFGGWRRSRDVMNRGQLWIKCGAGPGWILTLQGLALVETP